ncbi:hypothetical protein CEV34_2813 [Brucella pseudogrignonensis]|uniref:Uncharacterized protein n=1 Tax=Brucella pseudogrignonensis TaxID=419475 RepID=A0A256GF56_9HYPH|nr:hypothetical protein CEV34_2813 [Brucella pseudogrignonensis]
MTLDRHVRALQGVLVRGVVQRFLPVVLVFYREVEPFQ